MYLVLSGKKGKNSRLICSSSSQYQLEAARATIVNSQSSPHHQARAGPTQTAHRDLTYRAPMGSASPK